jgi:hypothetical protein
MNDTAVDDTANTLASPGQRLLWLMDHYRGGNGMMGVPILYRLRGHLDVGALTGAVADLTARHEALRLVFDWDRRRLTQRALPAAEVPGLTTETLTADGLETGLRAFLRDDIDTASSSIRPHLIRLGEDDHLFALNIHHLVTDAWSNMLLSRDLAYFYNRRLSHPVSEPPEVVWQYSDYVRWHHRHLQGSTLRGHEDFWSSRLAGARSPLIPPLPHREGRVRPPAANEWFTLSPDLVEALRLVARRERTTLFVVMLSLFFSALHEVTGQRDLTVGSIFANRSRREVRETVGFFANMVPIRTEIEDTAGTIAHVRRSVLETMEHEEFPYLTLPLAKAGDTEARPEDVVFHMLATPPTAKGARPDLAGLTVESHRLPDGLGSRFDLELLILPAPDGLEGVFRFAADRCAPDYVRTLVDHYRALARRLTAETSPIAASR